MYYVGIDLGGTNIAVGVIDEEHKIIGSSKKKTGATRPADEIFDDIAATVEEAIKDAGVNRSEIAYVGLGTPGAVNQETGVIEFAGNLNFNNVSAKAMLEERLGITAYVANDANAAALGEAIAGAGHGVKNFVAITLGTGVGSGVIIDGKILGGYNSVAGEIGHVVINVDGEHCTCGRNGCWEAYASATALIRQTKAAMKENRDSKMWDFVDDNIDNVSGRTAFEAMREGDEAGKQVVDRYIYYVAVGIINIINSLQPEMICIGGGISKEGDTLLKPIHEHVRRERFSKHSVKQTTVCCAKLGNDAGIIGAALLGRGM